MNSIVIKPDVHQLALRASMALSSPSGRVMLHIFIFLLLLVGIASRAEDCIG